MCIDVAVPQLAVRCAEIETAHAAREDGGLAFFIRSDRLRGVP